MFAKSPPIHRIPVETLAEIFTSALDVPDPQNAGLPPAILLRSVCQRWKVVAEGTSCLWPDIIGPYGHEWTRRALLWSKDCPLDIDLYNYDTGREKWRRIKNWALSTALIIPEILRARSIIIECRDSHIARRALQSSLPRLEVLEIHGPDDGAPDHTSFAGKVPIVLRDLALIDCAASPRCPMFQAPLTSLTIENGTIWTSMNDLMCTLAMLPCLETFYWTLIYEGQLAPLPLAASTEPSPQLVQLLRLKCINIRTWIQFITYFFAHTTLPASCSATIAADLDHIVIDDMQSLFRALDAAFAKNLRAAFPGDDPSAGFGSLTINDSEFQTDAMEGVTFAWSKPTVPTGPAHFHLAFLPNGPDMTDMRSKILTTVYHMLNTWPATRCAVSEVRNEHGQFLCETEYMSEDDTWTQILRYLPSVERLELHHTVDGLADALSIISLKGLQQVNIRDADISFDDIKGLIDALEVYEVTAEGITKGTSPVLRLEDCRLDGMPFKVLIV